MATTTIRLSLWYTVLILALLLCIGVAGGALGSRLFAPSLPLTSDTNQTIVPVSQQITVSPSTLVSDLASNHAKSVFLLANDSPKGITAFGTGVALTNDGIIMSATGTTKEDVIAIGDDGVAAPLTLIGQDELSGIFFYKTSGRIVAPFNLSSQTPRIGSSLVTLYRQDISAQASAHTTTLTTILLPPEKSAPGIQRLAHIESATPLPFGAALVDENGSLAGVLLDPETNIALLTSDIRQGLERLSANRLSENPFTALGFTVTWKAQLDTNRTMRIESVIASVSTASPSHTAGLQVGDVLTAISGNTVSWDTNIAAALTAKSLSLTIMRAGEQRTITINQ